MNKNAKDRAYQKLRKMFADYIEADKKGYSFTSESLRNQYAGACRLYEEIFEEEFILTTEDRHEIIGVQTWECEDFIRNIFKEKDCKGIELNCFWEMAEESGLWKRGEYGTAMSDALENLTKVVEHTNDAGEWIYSAFELK